MSNSHIQSIDIDTSELDLTEPPEAVVTLQQPIVRHGVPARDIRSITASSRQYIDQAILAIRWATVLVGLGFAVDRAMGGELRIVATLAFCVFITSFRTVNPINYRSRSTIAPLFFACADVAILSISIGVTDGFANPFVGCVFAAIALVAFGWGMSTGVLAAVIALASTNATMVAFGIGPDTPDYGRLVETFALFAVVGVMPAVALKKIFEVEGRGQALRLQRDRLAETNNLLEVLNELARTLPSSLDFADAVFATKTQLLDAFEPDRIALLAKEEGAWAPVVQDGFGFAPRVDTADLPDGLAQATYAYGAHVISDLTRTQSGGVGSGMYVRLIANNQEIALIAVESAEPHRFAMSDKNLLDGMADVLGLTLANARSFNKLRSLAADEERNRIARDLHDRLGQYLTYIALEIERIKSDVSPKQSELETLHGEVRAAIAEFRDTLIELRTNVNAERSLNVVLKQVAERFEKRSNIAIDLQLAEQGKRLPSPIENELLRITQEALTNIEKHSGATSVYIRWSITNDIGVLLINDNGKGFEPTKGIRGSAYGLVGMRERAAAVGAHLEINSRPGHGTNIIVQTRTTTK